MGYGKHQTSGPYSVNGYRPSNNMSHLDFNTGDIVNYIGTHKNDSQYYIKNGTKGVILEKDAYNKHKKVPRSVLKVEFVNKGIRYVHKNVLQHVSDYDEYVKGLIDKTGLFNGYQHSRNEYKKGVKETVRPDRYKEILNNRAKRKLFREWRKGFLDSKELELYSQVEKIQSSPEYKKKKELYTKLKTEFTELTSVYTNDINSTIEDTKSYNLKKVKDETRIKELKNDLYSLEMYLNNLSDETRSVSELLHSKSRQFIRGVNSKHDYNKYLHFEYEKLESALLTDWDYIYKEHAYKPSRQYMRCPEGHYGEPREPKNIDLILWGLTPRDVYFH
jgi:hypothetical protein